MHSCTEERFLGDVKDHEMTIHHAADDIRRIQFSRNGSSVYRFDIITWPGFLAITGDMGAYVFSRTFDMFDFFWMDNNDFNLRDGQKLSINPGYWAEKLQAEDKQSKAEEWSKESFEEAVEEYLASYFDGEEDAEFEEAVRAEVQENVSFMVEAEYEAMCAIEEFEYVHPTRDQNNNLVTRTFRFQDFWEYDCKKYSFHYIWCLYAIVWGIKQYKKETSQ